MSIIRKRAVARSHVQKLESRANRSYGDRRCENKRDQLPVRSKPFANGPVAQELKRRKVCISRHIGHGLKLEVGVFASIRWIWDIAGFRGPRNLQREKIMSIDEDCGKNRGRFKRREICSVIDTPRDNALGSAGSGEMTFARAKTMNN
jgi:hypothetical protein